MIEQFLTLVVAPLLVGLVTEVGSYFLIKLVSHWLDEKDDN